jgi:uncharacterized protein (TIGR00369 family)
MAELRHVDNCVGCSRTNPSSLGIRVSVTPDGAEGLVRFGRDAEGAPGLVHGGLLATLADEVMGYLPHGGNAVRVTAEMTIRYLRPTPTETELCCRASAIERAGRKFRVRAIITAAGDDEPLAEAHATYVVLAADDS